MLGMGVKRCQSKAGCGAVATWRAGDFWACDEHVPDSPVDGHFWERVSQEVCEVCGGTGVPVDLSEIKAADLVAATGVSERQAYRWKAGTSRPHPAALRILKKEGLV